MWTSRTPVRSPLSSRISALNNRKTADEPETGFQIWSPVMFRRIHPTSPQRQLSIGLAVVWSAGILPAPNSVGRARFPVAGRMPALQITPATRVGCQSGSGRWLLAGAAQANSRGTVRVLPLTRFSFAAGKQGEIAKILRLAPAPSIIRSMTLPCRSSSSGKTAPNPIAGCCKNATHVIPRCARNDINGKQLRQGARLVSPAFG